MAADEPNGSRRHHDLDLTPFRCKSQASSWKTAKLEFRVPEEGRKKDCPTKLEDDTSFVDQRSRAPGDCTCTHRVQKTLSIALLKQTSYTEVP
eukprot:3611783-Karenia_brevis.AAC.1